MNQWTTDQKANGEKSCIPIEELLITQSNRAGNFEIKSNLQVG